MGYRQVYVKGATKNFGLRFEISVGGFNHRASLTASRTAIYSNSVKVATTKVYFFVIQQTVRLPNNLNQYLSVLRLLLYRLQSESIYSPFKYFCNHNIYILIWYLLSLSNIVNPFSYISVVLKYLTLLNLIFSTFTILQSMIQNLLRTVSTYAYLSKYFIITTHNFNSQKLFNIFQNNH